jgi:hypothetical protein
MEAAVCLCTARAGEIDNEPTGHPEQGWEIRAMSKSVLRFAGDSSLMARLRRGVREDFPRQPAGGR